MFDTGLWLFVALIVLFVWRGLCWWKCCGVFLRSFNYITLLLVVLFVILCYDCYEFGLAFFSRSVDSVTWNNTPGWLKAIVYASPFVVWVGYVLGAHQVYQHIVCIQEGSAVLRHDRAVQIIVLPVVYSTMCMSCVTKCFAFMMADNNAQVNSSLPLDVAKAETCLWIGDLYESWALYQFGVLSLEVMKSSLFKQSVSQNQEERAAAKALMVAHGAVSSLAWLGILSFVLVSVADSAVALWYLTLGVDSPNLVHRFNNAENQFNVAGFLASGAAIFNVYIVEQQFHFFLEDFHPFMKFLTVKILVTFAYGQEYFFYFLQFVNEASPKHVQTVIRDIPMIGSLVNFTPAEFNVFYAALLIIECLFIGIAHLWAWGSTESWYDEEEDNDLTETKALMPGESLLYKTAGV